VELFLAEGAQVAFCARGAAGVLAAQEAFGERAFGSAVVVTNPAEIESWINAASERMGGIDIGVPNVSASAGGGDLATWRKAFETDLLGTVSMATAALAFLKQSSAASIVLISSVLGREVDMFAEPYGVLKAALIHYGKTLSVHHAPDGIRVNSVSPGNVYFADGVWERSSVRRRSSSPNAWHAIRWDGWRHRPRSRKRCGLSPVRQPASSPGRTF